MNKSIMGLLLIGFVNCIGMQVQNIEPDMKMVDAANNLIMIKDDCKKELESQRIEGLAEIFHNYADSTSTWASVHKTLGLKNLKRYISESKDIVNSDLLRNKILELVKIYNDSPNLDNPGKKIFGNQTTQELLNAVDN